MDGKNKYTKKFSMKWKTRFTLKSNISVLLYIGFTFPLDNIASDTFMLRVIEICSIFVVCSINFSFMNMCFFVVNMC